jgi:hypothetical protein
MLNYTDIEKLLRQVTVELEDALMWNPQNYNKEYVQALKDTWQTLTNLKRYM